MVAIWGVNFSVIKLGLAGIRPLAFNALRFPLAALVVYVALRRRGPIPLPVGGDRWRVLVLGVVGNVFYQVLFILGMERAPAGIASLLLSSSPLLTAILSSALGQERVALRVWVGVSATLAGLGLVIVGGAESGVGGPLAGYLLMLGASTTWAIYTVGSRRLVERYGSVAFTAWTLWCGAIGLAVVGMPAVLATPLAHTPAASWAAIGYSGTLAIGVAYMLWYYGVSQIGTTHTSIYSNVVPVVALGVAWLWLGEVPATIQLVGAAVVIAGVMLARLGE